ncbi:ParA family protein [Actinoplanes sp. RD1]|uniref:ParA family protein n=1 Tax=Actinoplanes sp. RD1 TaxID=3064538 RepID=UPI0027412B56|nr:AAA family ATPase [Actinoplanes sp. RD1]
MPVVSVMNYKGGVGKTTLTANVAAEIADNGYRVLMIDLDPQTNLTFSFFTVEEWNTELRERRTIKRWYDSGPSSAEMRLEDLVLSPPRVNERVARSGGRLDLISSHLGLIDIDLELALLLGGMTPAQSRRKFLEVHGCLAEALRAPAFRAYDIVLIDCAPNFGLVTKTAIVASDFVLVPAKPDYLSTIGIGYLKASVEKLVTRYNEFADEDALARRIDPRFAGVAFTMTQVRSEQPIIAQRTPMENLREAGIMPIFGSSVRNSPQYFAESGERGVPAILRGPLDHPVSQEMRALIGEFVEAVAGERARA